MDLPLSSMLRFLRRWATIALSSVLPLLHGLTLVKRPAAPPPTAAKQSNLAVDHLSSLPTELPIKILEVIPIREVCQLRILSRPFQALVDSNEEAITLLTICSNRTRLLSRMHWLINLENLDLIDIIDRYCSYYGDIIVESNDGTINGILDDTILLEASRSNIMNGLTEQEQVTIGLWLLDLSGTSSYATVISMPLLNYLTRLYGLR
ncbi:hypothetical protein LTR95_016925 [Oleoguttula sp. CCFEE 5521]